MKTIKDSLLIAKKNFFAYFESPIAYIIVAMFLFLTGFLFFQHLAHFQQNAHLYTLIRHSEVPTITEQVLIPTYGAINFILLIITPFITMRLIAEEKKEKTLALLLSSPIRALSIVLGKYFSAVLFTVFILLGTLSFPAILFVSGNIELPIILSSYLGIILSVSTYVALGLFCSSCTENQIIAGALSFGGLLFLWLISWAAKGSGTFWSEFLTQISLVAHFSNFTYGIIDTADIFYFLSLIFFFLFATCISFDTRQWR